MTRLTPLDWRAVSRIFKAEGFVDERTKGSHLILEKPGHDAPVVIPMKKDVKVGIISSCMRAAGMSRERFFELRKITK